MDCNLVDILYLSEAFWVARIVNYDIEPTYGAPIFAYSRTGEASGIDLKWIQWDLNPGLPSESPDC